MADLLQFVDSIASSPSVRLNLNDGATWKNVAEGTRFPPPPLRRAVASTLLVDGGRVTAAAYDNRIVQLRLVLRTASADLQATQIQALARELDRPTNFLRWHPDGATNPVFFRTMRSDIAQLDQFLSRQQVHTIDLEILAEPFALGLKETLGGTLNANPYFETDANNWTVSGGTFVRSTAQFHEGAASGLLTPDGVTATSVARAELVPALAGSLYRASVWVRCAAARNVSVNIDWWTAVGGFISTSSVTVAVAANTWTLLTVTAAAPATTGQAGLTVSMGSTPLVSHLLHIDEATLAQSFIVNNDPAATANGMFFDAISVKGDVETPLVLTIDNADVGTTGRRISAIGVRRRGTPSNAPLVLQCEAMTPSTDTSAPGNDAAMSGSGSNYLRCTFATNQAMATRATITAFPSSPGTDLRGTYRVFLRCRKSVGGDTIQARLQYGATTSQWVTGETKTVPQANTSLQLVELEKVSFPLGYDPVYDGLSGVERSVLGLQFQLQLARTAGSGNLDVDYLLFVPADDRFCLVEWSEFSGPVSQVLDSITESAYLVGSSGELRSDQVIEVVGGFPMISPGVTNRVVFCKNAATTTNSDTKTDTINITPSYYPRYQNVRPAST